MRKRAALVMLSLLPYATVCVAAESGSGSEVISLSEAYGLKGSAERSMDLYVSSERPTHEAGPGDRLFNAVMGSGEPSPRGQFGNSGDTIVERPGTGTGLTVKQSGLNNHLTSTQGDLAMLLVSQRGSYNEIRTEQGTGNNVSSLSQTGDYNLISGSQGGMGGLVNISQTGSHQVAVYSQSGTGSILTIHQH